MPKWLCLKKPVPKWVALVSGHMGQNLRKPSCLILSHIQMASTLDMAALRAWSEVLHFSSTMARNSSAKLDVLLGEPPYDPVSATVARPKHAFPLQGVLSSLEKHRNPRTFQECLFLRVPFLRLFEGKPMRNHPFCGFPYLEKRICLEVGYLSKGCLKVVSFLFTEPNRGRKKR